LFFDSVHMVNRERGNAFLLLQSKKEVFTPSCQICFGTNAEPSREEKRERRKEGPQTTFS
ncbi:MAG: hypothetical protein RRY07_10420, partial [Bacteroidaceae bacterium]